MLIYLWNIHSKAHTNMLHCHWKQWKYLVFIITYLSLDLKTIKCSNICHLCAYIYNAGFFCKKYIRMIFRGVHICYGWFVAAHLTTGKLEYATEQGYYDLSFMVTCRIVPQPTQLLNNAVKMVRAWNNPSHSFNAQTEIEYCSVERVTSSSYLMCVV
jgi:hypothetical protein